MNTDLPPMTSPVFTPIHAWVFDPTDAVFNRTGKSECKVHFCQLPDQCPLLKNKQCILNLLLGPGCPYGQIRVETGMTKRARGFHKWIHEKKEKYNSVLGALSSPPEKMSQIGGWIYLPYPHIDMNGEINWLRQSLYFVSGRPFIKFEDFTLRTIKSIVEFRPQSLLGGEITDYQKIHVPKFIEHLQEVFPYHYAELIKHLPQYAIQVKNYIGRKALLHTVNPGTVDMGGTKYEWDGMGLSSSEESAALLSGVYDRNGRRAILRVLIRPTGDAVTKIIRNDQVSINTQFVD